MTDHQHVEHSRSGKVEVRWCRCGKERRNGRKRWMEPTTSEGIEIRKAWDAREKETA